MKKIEAKNLFLINLADNLIDGKSIKADVEDILFGYFYCTAPSPPEKGKGDEAEVGR